MLYDITPLISTRLAVWPGDTPPTRRIIQNLADGDSVTLSTLDATVHLGAHADAPCHYGLGERDIAAMPIERYLGPCQVVRARATPGTPVGVTDIDEEITEPRVLIATGTFLDHDRWTPNFSALDPELVDMLAERGVFLVGVDTPSVDPADSKTLPAHHRCLAHDIVIVEGLVLRDVPPGRYELIALPLKLEAFDASPVRAVLRTINRP